MGDLEGGPLPSGLDPKQAAAYADFFALSRSVNNVRWKQAEQCTEELIKRIRGTRSSEKRRKEVADYVAYLIRNCLECQECQVNTFGSVPLKTYLPDGDIDLTIVSRDPHLKDTWANAVRSALEKAERNQDGNFRVENVQYINAEVKLIKCHVENIVVDISFNQCGGLSTLCFLDEVDGVIGKDHFFKRSIILVKAWCYYESVILGAHNSLISTYALETLVLYIFHVFHSSLRGPLEILLRFLEFFGNFDWENYAVSVWGPVPLSSLPDMAAEPPRKDGGELLLSKQFLDGCVEEYCVKLTGQDNNHGRAFTKKYLNIVDPLRPSNNLGRSVNQTHFIRIKSGLRHSAKELLNILLDSSKDIDEYFQEKKPGFFSRTIRRLGQFEAKRPDAAAGGVAQFATTTYEDLHYQKYQNGWVVGNVNHGETHHSFVAETNNGGPNLKTTEGWTSELETRKPASAQLTQIGGSQGNTSHLSSTSKTGSDTSVQERALHDSRFGNVVLASGGDNGNFFSVPESSHVPGYTGGKGSFSNGEAVAIPSGLTTKPRVDAVFGITEKSAKASREQGDASGSVGGSTQSSEGWDTTSSVDDSSFRASVARRSSFTQTDFENNGASVNSNESPSSESSRGSVNFFPEGIPEVSIPTKRINLNHSIEAEVSRRNSRVGEQPLYVATSGFLDGQGYAQQRGQDPVSRGPIPLPVSVIPHAQIPVTLPHQGQIPLHLATSMAASQSMPITGSAPPFGLHTGSVTSSVMGESPLGIGSHVGPYYLQLQRGPPAPPLPRRYYHGTPLGHHLPTMGEIPNTAGRTSTTFPAQQGEVQSFEQQQVWPQMEPMQVHGHGYSRPVFTNNAAVSTLPHLNSENSMLITSAPAIVTSGPFHVPVNLPAPRSQTAESAPGNARITHNGLGNLDSLASSVINHTVFEDVNQDAIGNALPDHGEVGNLTPAGSKLSPLVKSEAGPLATKSSKSGKEKRMGNKGKSSSNEDVFDVRSSEAEIPFAGAESGGQQPTQGITDFTNQMSHGHPHLLSVVGTALGPPIYPNFVSSSSPPQGSGLMATELSPFSPPPPPPPPPMVTNTQITVGHPSLLVQTSLLPSSSSNSSWPPVPELVNGASNLGTKQRQRPTESAPSVYYPPGNPYQFQYSMYNTTIPSQVYVVPRSPDQTLIGLDLFSGMYSSKPFDSYKDSSGGQGEDWQLRISQPGRPGVGERLRAAGVATSSVSGSEATKTDARASDTLDSTFSSSDLLSSDFSNHLRNLDHARWCQNSRVSAQHRPQYVASYYRQWEGPGRPLTANGNLYPMMNYGSGLVQGLPTMSTSMRMVPSFPRTFAGPGSFSGEELPRSHGGTGTYLPTPRPPFIRDRQSSGNGRNQNGGYSQERGDRVDREGNQVHGPRLRGNGRGHSKYDPRPQSINVSVERNNGDLKGGDRVRDRDILRQYEGQRRNLVQSIPATSLTSSSVGVTTATLMAHAPAGLPAEMYSAPIMTGNGKSLTSGAVGGTIPSVIVTNPLEFGSVGQVQVAASQAGSEVDNGACHNSSLRTPEQVNARIPPVLADLSLASGDGSSQGPSSPKERPLPGMSFEFPKMLLMNIIGSDFHWFE